MSWLDGWRHRLRTLVNPGGFERELRDEMRFHEELDTSQQHDAARARRRFGNRTYYQEETRRMTWLGSLDVWRQDLGYAWRSIRRAPAFTAMVVLTLALGLGANAATFSVLDRIYFRAPAGVANPETIRRLWFEHSAERMSDGKKWVSPAAHYPLYAAIAQANGDPRSFALYDTDHSLYVGSGPNRRRVRGVFANANYFSVLGVRPVLGRVYTSAEDSLGNGSPVVVLSHRFWRDALEGDSAILGTTLRIEGEPYTVIGVLQPDFTGIDLQAKDVWIPLASIPSSHWIRRGKGRWWEGYRSWGFEIIQRAPASDTDRAFDQRATLAARDVNKRLFSDHPDTTVQVRTGPLYGGGPGELGQDMKIATRLAGVAVIVLLIACANVVNLLLARAMNRRREIAVRLALGVSRSRLVRLLTTETVLLASLAGAAALLAGWWGGTVLRSQLFRSVVWYESALHWRVVAFSIVTALVAGIIAGVVPALQASKPELTRELKEGTKGAGTHRSGLRTFLVVAQAALSVVLLVGATLFVRSLQNVQGIDIGYDADRLLFGTVSFEPGQDVPPAIIAGSMGEIQTRLRSRPGVEIVARAFDAPMQSISFTTFYWGADSSASLTRNYPTFLAVSPEFFRATGLRIVAGGVFNGTAGGPLEIVINRQLAGTLWPGRDPIGQCIHFKKRDNPCYRVVGVAENARQGKILEEGPKAQFFVPVGDGTLQYQGTTLIVRTAAQSTQAAAAEMRAALASAFPSGQVKVRTMMDDLDGEYWPWRLGARLFTGFGLLALLVAVIGIYSTVAYGVSQRTHEFGVRAALGARVGDVLRLVVGEGLRIVAIGVFAGVVLALAAGKLVATLLYGVAPSDPWVLIGVSVTLLLVAALAALAPAWRASRVDPVTALRAE